jgi:hypothetical protein
MRNQVKILARTRSRAASGSRVTIQLMVCNIDPPQGENNDAIPTHNPDRVTEAKTSSGSCIAACPSRRRSAPPAAAAKTAASRRARLSDDSLPGVVVRFNATPASKSGG